MARGTNLAVYLDLQNNPLGTGRGENFSVPSNYQIPPARIYFVNHSRTRPWRRVKIGVSARRGAEAALIYDKELAKVYNVDTLVRAVESGKDMNRYEKGVKPVIFTFRCGGQTYAVPPAKDKDSEPPRVEVREGSWDLFLGNYDRMRAVDKDGRPDTIVRNDEKMRLARFWQQRHNPVFRLTDDGDATDMIQGDEVNPFGFIEVVRVTQKSVMEPIDKEYLTALDLVEAS